MHPPPDPPNDTIGWENGYWSNEPINVSQTGDDYGLSEAERKRFLARTMARVERIRGLEFVAPVRIRAISRSAYRRELRNGSIPLVQSPPTTYEAMFVFGERRNVTEVLRRLYGRSVVGYVRETQGQDTITVISPSPERPSIDPAFLAHELVHVLQDQHGLEQRSPARNTTDGRTAKTAIVEGDASLVEHFYRRTCDASVYGSFECVEPATNWTTATGSAGLAPAFNRLVDFIYSDGAVFLDERHQYGDWSRVNEVYDHPPATTAKLIHPDTEINRSRVTVTDTSSAAWRIRATDRLGEAGAYTMLYAGSIRGDWIVEFRSTFRTQEPYDRVNFESELSSGWRNDRLVIYSNGTHRGYVWKSVWASPADAKQFHRGYRRVLKSFDGIRLTDRVWIVNRRGFADAFYVARSNDTIRVVNAPTIAQLAAIDSRAGIRSGELGDRLSRLNRRLYRRNTTIAAIRAQLKAKNDSLRLERIKHERSLDRERRLRQTVDRLKGHGSGSDGFWNRSIGGVVVFGGGVMLGASLAVIARQVARYSG